MAELTSFIDAFLTRVWVGNDVSDLDREYQANAALTGLEDMPLDGIDDFLRFHRMVQAQFRLLSYRTLASVENGDWVSTFGEFIAADRQTGQRGTARVHMILQVSRGQIVGGHVLLDYLGFFEQVGRLPARTLDRCLLDSSGQWHTRRH
ncbi:nuclear transport factor 2 family protein [Thalassococcus sp. BH17M4-6]|uniref:nuclear transport factor 2 family protein n=1 Tax=Thalassococcus sp. BH17M4-6 TaxID=3413148 RepID=UPI003BC74872